MFGLGNLLGAGLSFLGGIVRNNSAEDMAENQMGFQERMSNTAYQRATADMKAAGLNPMLAYSQGGASAPLGSMPDVQDVVSPAVSTAQTQYKLRQEVENMQTQQKNTESVTAVNEAQKRNIDVDTALKEQTIPKIQSDIVHTQASVGQIGATIKNLEEQNKKLTAEIANIVSTGPKIKAEIAEILENTKYLNAQTAFSRVSALLSKAHIQLTNAQTLELKSLLGSKIDLASAEVRLRQNAIPESEALKNYFESSYGKASPYIDSVIGNVGGFAGSALGGALGAVFGSGRGSHSGAIGNGKVSSKVFKK